MIKTKRLSIQPFQEADCTGMVNLLCNEEIKKTFMIPDFATKSMAERLFHQFRNGHMRKRVMSVESILVISSSGLSILWRQKKAALSWGM